MNEHKNLSRFEIADIQLQQALNLYSDGRDLISTITLAGAAEEILGGLVSQAGETLALKEKVANLRGMHEFVWGEEANEKAYVEIRNQARNCFKHFGNGNEVFVDLELEAVSLLKRAIANYMKLVPGSKFKFMAFEKEFLRRWRKKQDDCAQLGVERDA